MKSDMYCKSSERKQNRASRSRRCAHSEVPVRTLHRLPALVSSNPKVPLSESSLAWPVLVSTVDRTLPYHSRFCTLRPTQSNFFDANSISEVVQTAKHPQSFPTADLSEKIGFSKSPPSTLTSGQGLRSHTPFLWVAVYTAG